MLELPAHFFKDLRLAQLAHAYYWACVLLIAVFLQTDQKQISRTAAGIFITTALLVVQPFIYDSSTQTYGIGLASYCCLGAWTLLHWTFIEQKKPSVLQVCISTVRHRSQACSRCMHDDSVIKPRVCQQHPMPSHLSTTAVGDPW